MVKRTKGSLICGIGDIKTTARNNSMKEAYCTKKYEKKVSVVYKYRNCVINGSYIARRYNKIIILIFYTFISILFFLYFLLKFNK